MIWHVSNGFSDLISGKPLSGNVVQSVHSGQIFQRLSSIFDISAIHVLPKGPFCGLERRELCCSRSTRCCASQLCLKRNDNTSRTAFEKVGHLPSCLTVPADLATTPNSCNMQADSEMHFLQPAKVLNSHERGRIGATEATPFLHADKRCWNARPGCHTSTSSWVRAYAVTIINIPQPVPKHLEPVLCGSPSGSRA